MRKLFTAVRSKRLLLSVTSYYFRGIFLTSYNTHHLSPIVAETKMKFLLLLVLLPAAIQSHLYPSLVSHVHIYKRVVFESTTSTTTPEPIKIQPKNIVTRLIYQRAFNEAIKKIRKSIDKRSVIDLDSILQDLQKSRLVR